MNIFVTNTSPQIAAREHCDKHVRKMVIEYAQLLSTAHRFLDGEQKIVMYQVRTFEDGVVVKERTKKRPLFLLPSERAHVLRTQVCHPDDPKYVLSETVKLSLKGTDVMMPTHAGHPSAIWARSTRENYEWLVELWVHLLEQFKFRHGKEHAVKARTSLLRPPKNLKSDRLTEFPQAMPEKFKVPNDPVLAYQRFYIGEKSRFATWSGVEPPEWFKAGIIEKDGVYRASSFERTRRVPESSS